MRISSGFARGISLSAPKGDSTRPATDAAREAIFSSLGELVVDAKVLDLFAGTGAYGLEAASRGAKSVVFVEKNSRAIACLRENIAKVSKAMRGKAPSMEIVPADCFKLEKLFADRQYDVVFADPPYKFLFEKKQLEDLLCSIGKIAASSGSTCVLEAPAEFELPRNLENFSFEMKKRLGKKSKGKPSQIIFTVKI